MTIQEILTTLSNTPSLLIFGVVLITSLIEISPIKVNPLSWIAKHIGRAINGEVLHEVSGVKTELDTVKGQVADLRTTQQESEALTARRNILRFGDEIRHNVKHSKDHFDSVLADCTKYRQYCSAHPEFFNQMTESTISLVTRTYDKCLEENDFL